MSILEYNEGPGNAEPPGASRAVTEHQVHYSVGSLTHEGPRPFPLVPFIVFSFSQRDGCDYQEAQQVSESTTFKAEAFQAYVWTEPARVHSSSEKAVPLLGRHEESPK